MSEQVNWLSEKNIKRFWRWGPLLFTSFYLLPTMFNFQQLSWLTITLILVFYVVFIVLYIKAVSKNQQTMAALLTAMLAVCISASFFTSGTSTLFGFTAYIAGFCFSKVSRVIAGLSVVISIVFSAYFTDINNPQYFLGGSLILCIALFSFGVAAHKERIYKMREQENAKQLEQLAAIAERERIARDLHDILGHSLSSIALKAELASKLNHAERYSHANSEIEQVAELARQLLSDVRTAVSDLKELNIHSQLEQLQQRLKEQGFAIEFNARITKLPAKVEGFASLIIKEAVTNLLRHSTSKHCDINLWQSDEQLEIKVVNYDHCEKIHIGNGLNGIKERAAQLGGNVDISIGKCFSLHVMLPFTVAPEEVA
ncbi:sensor histidine kinase [Pseudoalteromonas mariniglutinosa]|uniref:sensor histidine kinase n=1 Tax=Pseudoalteromonas mariniglutinosa TaxID=206042 RepID=UPI00384FD430